MVCDPHLFHASYTIILSGVGHGHGLIMQWMMCGCVATGDWFQHLWTCLTDMARIALLFEASSLPLSLCLTIDRVTAYALQ